MVDFFTELKIKNVEGMRINMIFEKASIEDINEISELYDAVCDYLASDINYPGWKKGIYPIREDALEGLRDNALYIMKDENRIAGTVMLKHKPEEGYRNVKWNTGNDYEKIYVIYTLAVHPDYRRMGVGSAIMEEVEKIARNEGCVSIRLDVVKDNYPAEKLYVRQGFQYVATISLGHEAYGLPWYNLYEKCLS